MTTSTKRRGPYHALLLIAALLGGCNSKRADVSAAPASATTESTAPVMEPPRSPTILARFSEGDPKDIAIDSQAVYVTVVDSTDMNLSANIVRIPIGGGPPTVLASKQRGGQSLVAVNDALFWIAGGDIDRNIPDAVVKLPSAGGKVTRVGKTFLFADAALVSDGTNLYFGDYHDKTGRLMKMPVSGGKATEIAVYNNDSIAVLAVDSTNAYWVSLSSLVKAPLAGGPVTVLIKNIGIGNVWGLVSDGKYLYYTDRNDYVNDDARRGAVRRIPVDGGPIETIASGLRGRPWGIATDATHVYWVINAERDGGIMRAPKNGGAASVVVGDQASPVKLALDGRYVYWANASGDRAVAKALKEPEK